MPHSSAVNHARRPFENRRNAALRARISIARIANRMQAGRDAKALPTMARAKTWRERRHGASDEGRQMNLAYDLSKRGDMSRIFERGPKFQPRAPNGERRKAGRGVRTRRRPRRHGVGRWLAGLGTGLGALIILGALAKPGMFVRLLPRTAEVYAAMGWSICAAWRSSTSRPDSRKRKRPVPHRRGAAPQCRARQSRRPAPASVSFADAPGRPSTAWTASSGIKALPPGETAPFRARLAAPPTEAQAVTVDLVPE